MDVRHTTRGERNLPRFFPSAMRVASQMRNGRLDFVLPDGRRFRVEGQNPGPEAELRIKDADVFSRLIRDGDLGFCEAYVEGGWDTPDLQAFMDLVHADNDALFDGFPGMGLIRAWERGRFWLRRNSRKQARRNISAHYDLGNGFYGLWLDPSMTYSSAYFRDGNDDLETAQQAKYANLLDMLGVGPGDHVLEIGCGWGGFAEFAARERGLRVTALTISREQHDYATRRIAQAGLADQVEIVMRDYRDETGSYDAIASIEMFEAVGEQYWPVYFDTLKARLKPGGRAGLQIITVQDRRWEVYRKGVDFIQKYIFPGGMLPSPTALREQVARAGLDIVGSVEFAESYSRTLRLWYDRFNGRWDEAREMGFDEGFRRMWNLYLTSCAATFHSRNCDVTQIAIARPA
ncbi:SAM-dependent methyltransferase [Brevirhabdus pacifica]|uniref:SAM-dependent methyltransferase n=1 Tax=Brevirhabdus pacifica TaxID=1267768 RepID=A0A1U7DFM5_9RHOB|nr:cyclopropane-fatty-acyl-phospholipid synthase family protein [Brevirhabdus pacifica]APX88761.1 SAM-dependent methyltransferase [Brevirhabdus pacifica]OWU80015.1 cyclopropane-fatty-acyl-phospholipid synthase [Loktanella sp. 22II-4b]PJJ86713.1 cyclopropane-fatty-acyl-phospholipid synthase [Brevirhabdus pacifica]